MFYYPGLTCTVEEPLLDGANPVPDSYFTASSEDPGWEAPLARMSTALYAWSITADERDANPPTCYIQVDK